MTKDRGVVLVYVVMLITLTAYLAALMLNSTMSRKMSSKITADSTQGQADTGAAQAIMTNCLAIASWPSTQSCSGLTNGAGCLTGTVAGPVGQLAASTPATFMASVCNPAGTVPCQLKINVCRVTLNDPDNTCPIPACP